MSFVHDNDSYTSRAVSSRAHINSSSHLQYNPSDTGFSLHTPPSQRGTQSSTPVKKNRNLPEFAEYNGYYVHNTPRIKPLEIGGGCKLRKPLSIHRDHKFSALPIIDIDAILSRTTVVSKYGKPLSETNPSMSKTDINFNHEVVPSFSYEEQCALFRAIDPLAVEYEDTSVHNSGYVPCATEFDHVLNVFICEIPPHFEECQDLILDQYDYSTCEVTIEPGSQHTPCVTIVDVYGCDFGAANWRTSVSFVGAGIFNNILPDVYGKLFTYSFPNCLQLCRTERLKKLATARTPLSIRAGRIGRFKYGRRIRARGL